MGAADDELARRVDEILDVVVEEGEYLVAHQSLDPRYEDVYHVLAYLPEHGLIVVGAVGLLDEVVVLGGNHDGVDALRDVVVGILHRHLAL